jgi:hypothetical protein
MIRNWLTLIAAFWLAGLAGCSTLASKPPEQALLERAQRYWQARQVRDLATILELEEAGRPGGWLTAMNVANLIGAGIRLSQVQVSTPIVDGATGQVTVSANAQYMAMAIVPGTFHQVVKDPWVLSDGRWYHKTHKWKSLAKIQKESEKRKTGQGKLDQPRSTLK